MLDLVVLVHGTTALRRYHRLLTSLLEVLSLAVVLSGLNLAFPFCESLLDLLDHALESLERLIQAFRWVTTILHS